MLDWLMLKEIGVELSTLCVHGSGKAMDWYPTWAAEVRDP